MTNNTHIPLILNVTIVDRENVRKVTSFFVKYGVTHNITFLGKGTASTATLSLLGLGETEKGVIFSTMPYENSNWILNRLHDEMNMNTPGKGIAFTLPLGSVCGVKTELCLRGKTKPIEDGDGVVMDNMKKGNFDLIMAITDKGHTDDVMEAARSAKATGGTVINARRVGLDEEAAFFGIKIQPEKEIVMILTPTQYRNAIMQAITSQAGLVSEAKTMVFSLPVNSVMGLSDVGEKDNGKAKK